MLTSIEILLMKNFSKELLVPHAGTQHMDLSTSIHRLRMLICSPPHFFYFRISSSQVSLLLTFTWYVILLHLQNAYNPYTAHQYVQVYGVPGALNTAVYPYGQLGQPLPGGHGFTAVQGYTVPGHHLMQISGQNVNGVTTASLACLW